MEQGEKPKVKKPAKIFVKLTGTYEASTFVGSAYDQKPEAAEGEPVVEYLSKPAIIQGLMRLLPQFEKQAHRNDANGILKKKMRDQKDAVETVIKQIAMM